MSHQAPGAAVFVLFLSCLTGIFLPAPARAQERPYTAPVVLQVTPPGAAGPITVTLRIAVTLPAGAGPASLPLTVTQAATSGGTVRVVSALPAEPVEGGRAVALTPGAISIPGLLATATPPAAAAAPEPTPALLAGTVNDAANLRTGPGTSYALAGKAQAGDAVQVAGRSADGEWYKLAGGKWIAAFLVDVEGAAGLAVVDAPSEAESWPRYELISGALSFAYPPSLKIEREAFNKVELNQGNLYGVALVVSLIRAEDETPIDLSNSQEALRLLKLILTSDEDADFRFLDEGRLDTRVPSIYVAGARGDSDSEVEIPFAVAWTTADSELVMIHYMHYGSPDISGEAVPDLTDLINSMQVP